MSPRASKRMTLLQAYEDLTRKETVCLREERFDSVGAVQLKKAKLLEGMSELRDEPPNEEEKVEFNRRIAQLKRQEDVNAKLLAEKIATNREEYRKLMQTSVSASKFKRAYSAVGSKPEQDNGSLEGRA